MPSDETFDAPGPGLWILDTGHLTAPCSGYHQALFKEGMLRGFRESLRRYGSFLESLDWAWVNGFPYYRLTFVGVPPGTGGHPPREAWDELVRSDPEVRDRLAASEGALAGRVWRDELARWDDHDRPAAAREHRALLAVDPDALDDEALLDHLARCTANVDRGVYLHHVYNLAAWIPVGDLIVHGTAWTGRGEAEILSLLQGATPDALGAEDVLRRLAAAVHADDEARALLDGPDPAASLAALRAHPGEAGAAAAEYVDLVAYRPVNGEDVGDTCAFELPELVLGSIRAAFELGAPGPAENDLAARTAAVRGAVPAEHRAAFDELLAEARAVYRLREERAAYGDLWAYGIARRALLAAGRRLGLREPADLVEATWPEVQAILRGDDGAPGAGELADRARYRREARFADAPPTLGGPEDAPFPLEWLPPAAARIERALGAAVGSLFGGPAPAGGDRVVRGTGAALGVVEGTARLVDSSAGFGRIQPGDILVTRATTTAFNIVLPLVRGIVTDRGGLLCHAAIVAREYGIPAVVGCGEATERIPDGARIRVDGAAGEVTIL